ncbi:MAG: protein translocase subunit SecF [Acidobacteriota bacterium]
MQILGSTHIDFLGKRMIAGVLSAALIAVSLWSLSGGINKGIDFAGGTEIQVKFAEPVVIDDLRSGLDERGIDASLQRIGDPADNEYLIRIRGDVAPGTAEAAGRPVVAVIAAAQDEPPTGETAAPADDVVSPEAAVDEAGSDAASDLSPEESTALAGALAPEEDQAPAAARPEGLLVGESGRIYQDVLRALREITGSADEDRLDLNVANEHEIDVLLEGGPDGRTGAAGLAAAIVRYRTTHAGLFHSFEDLHEVASISGATFDFLQAKAFLGPFTIRKVDFVGPRVGRELAEKAYLAMVFALIGMLIYITVRFRNLGYALGGIVALIHDGITAAGVFNLWGGQFDLTIVAALLTLLGYSINDTIVIFDRVRENMLSMRGARREVVFNTSINQTLSRTLLTSATTLLVVICLFVFGGDTIHGFAFVLLFGIVVGTYSTIFIASPVTLLYQRWSGRRTPGSKARSSASRRGQKSHRRSVAS